MRTVTAEAGLELKEKQWRKGMEEEGGRGEGRQPLKACQSLLIILIAELKLHAKA